MQTSQQKQKKVKVGTILNEEIYQRLKERAARGNRTIGGLIEEAVIKHEQEELLARELRLRAVDRLFATRFNLTDEDWKTIMEEDFYNQ